MPIRARALLWPCAFAAGSVLAALAMWGFTVDDALISIRYAHNLGSGAGYRFNADGPSTDGVTPLPWPFLLVPLSGGAPLVALGRVKALGVVLTAIAAALVGSRPGSAVTRIVSLVLLAACLPLAAYAASGMETPLATLLATLAVWSAARGGRAFPVFAGLAASVRPELLPWAVVLSSGVALARRQKPLAVFVAALASAAPFGACVVARWVAFGHPAPLALLAKPSDPSHGAVYVAAALVATGLPVLLVARPRSALLKVLVAAFVVHVVAVTLVGGDSMPYARLFVPLAPSLVMAHIELAGDSPAWGWWARSLAALGACATMLVVAAPRGRHVMAERAELISRARPMLANARRVATVDIGWVSAATSAHIVDLAGLTDPEIAALGGGHTSKRVSGAMLLDRDVDTLVLYDGHVVTERLSRDPVVRSHYDLAGELPHYVVVTRH